jgi:hypothetical protein
MGNHHEYCAGCDAEIWPPREDHAPDCPARRPWPQATIAELIAHADRKKQAVAKPTDK